MRPIKAIKSFSLNGIIYNSDDEIEIKNFNDLIRLNEKGFIKSLTAKELQEIKKEIENPKKKITTKEEKED